MNHKYLDPIDKKLQKYFVLLVTSINIFIIIFGRAGQEFRILNYRLGELFIALAFILSIYLLFTNVSKTYKLFVIYNIALLIIDFNFPLSFRLSSFVWAFSYFFIFKEFNLNEKYIKYIFTLLTIQHILFLVSYHNDVYFNWLNEMFGVGIYFKPSQQAVVSIFYIGLIKKLKLKLKFNFLILLLVCLSLNLVLVSSRGATLGLIFAFYFLYKNSDKKNERKFLLSIFLVSGLLLVSSYLLPNNNTDNSSQFSNIFNYSDLNEFIQITNVDYSQNIEKEYELSTYDEVSKFEEQCTSQIFPTNLSFGDGNINWRYGILVDTFNCVFSSINSIFFGFQYFEVMTPMIIEERDGLHVGLVNRGYPNYSPHNILLTVLYYGGFVNLILFFLLIFNINKKVSKLISPTLITFFIGGLFGVVFESVTQIIFWQFILLEKSISDLK